MGSYIDPESGQVGQVLTTPIDEQIAYYSARPPSAFAAFQMQPISLPDYPFDGHGEPVQSVFAVKCPCGGAKFSLSAHSDSENGESWICDPVLISCSDCGVSQTIFDMRVHGYDGSYGHNGWKGEPAGSPAEVVSADLSSPPWEIIVRFEYPSDLLGDEHSSSARGREQHFFSWITVVAKRDGKLATVFDAECA